MSVFLKNFAKIYIYKCHRGGANFAAIAVADICQKKLIVRLETSLIGHTVSI